MVLGDRGFRLTTGVPESSSKIREAVSDRGGGVRSTDEAAHKGLRQGKQLIAEGHRVVRERLAAAAAATNCGSARA